MMGDMTLAFMLKNFGILCLILALIVVCLWLFKKTYHHIPRSLFIEYVTPLDSKRRVFILNIPQKNDPFTAAQRFLYIANPHKDMCIPLHTKDSASPSPTTNHAPHVTELPIS